MNKTLAVFLIAAALLNIAATNLYVPQQNITFGTPTPSGTVHALPNAADTGQPPSNFSLLIAIAVPALISGLKSWVPKLPSWSLPIMAPAIGALMDWVIQLSGTPTNGVAVGALLGSAGVGLRELQDQVKQRMATSQQPQPPAVLPNPPKP